MDLWAFLWPIYSNYEIYLCLFPLTLERLQKLCFEMIMRVRVVTMKIDRKLVTNSFALKIR